MTDSLSRYVMSGNDEKFGMTDSLSRYVMSGNDEKFGIIYDYYPIN